MPNDPNDNMLNLRRSAHHRDEERTPVVSPPTLRERAHYRPSRATIAIAVFALFAAAIFYSGAFRSPWRAVFLSNNQVYFGKFWNVPFAPSITLREVYYLQVNQPIQPQDGSAAQSGLAVIKLGSEVHGPEDAMVIPARSILYWENLKNDSAVVRTIEEYKKRQGGK